jgi:hypothetical protein
MAPAQFGHDSAESPQPSAAAADALTISASAVIMQERGSWRWLGEDEQGMTDA